MIKGVIHGISFKLLSNGVATCGEGENPKSEARNPKQYPMIQIQMTKTPHRFAFVFNIGALVF
jgi:hypothetical protein